MTPPVQLNDLTAFARAKGGRCFAGWPAEILEIYLRWHLGNRTLIYATNATGRILGIMTVTRVNETDLYQHWKYDEAGDSLVVENAIAIRPGVLTTLIRRVQELFPTWRELKIFARRRSKKGWEKHRYTLELIERLIL